LCGKLAGRASTNQAPARRVSFSELLGSGYLGPVARLWLAEVFARWSREAADQDARIQESREPLDWPREPYVERLDDQPQGQTGPQEKRSHPRPMCLGPGLEFCSRSPFRAREQSVDQEEREEEHGHKQEDAGEGEVGDWQSVELTCHAHAHT